MCRSVHHQYPRTLCVSSVASPAHGTICECTWAGRTPFADTAYPNRHCTLATIAHLWCLSSPSCRAVSGSAWSVRSSVLLRDPREFPASCPRCGCCRRASLRPEGSRSRTRRLNPVESFRATGFMSVVARAARRPTATASAIGVSGRHRGARRFGREKEMKPAASDAMALAPEDNVQFSLSADADADGGEGSVTDKARRAPSRAHADDLSEPDTHKPRDSMVYMVAGVGGGCLSTLALHPFDTVKTRLQAAASPAAGAAHFDYRSVADAVATIARNEGLGRGLYRGVVPALLGSSISWGIYFECYQRAKALLSCASGLLDSQLLTADRTMNHLLSGTVQACSRCWRPIRYGC
eukprot:ctg_808.g278